MRAAKWKPNLRTLAFFQTDLWGEFLPGLREKKFKKLPQIFFGLSKRLSRKSGIRIRLRPRESKTLNGRISMKIRQLTKYYIGLRRSHFIRLYKKARRKLGIRTYGSSRAAYINAASDWSFRALESRVGNLAQRAYNTKSNRSLKQRLMYGHVSLNGAPVFSPSRLAKPGDVVTVTNFDKLSQGFSFSNSYSKYVKNSLKVIKKVHIGDFTRKRKFYFHNRKKVFSPLEVPSGQVRNYDLLKTETSYRNALTHYFSFDAVSKGSLFPYLVPYLRGRKTKGLWRTSSGQVLFLGGSPLKKDIYYPFNAKLYHFA